MKLPVFTDPVTRKPSVSLTIMVIAFTVVLTKWLAGGMSIRGHTFSTVSTAEIEAWITPTFFLYFGRWLTKAGTEVAMAKVGGKPSE